MKRRNEKNTYKQCKVLSRLKKQMKVFSQNLRNGNQESKYTSNQEKQTRTTFHLRRDFHLHTFR